MQSFKRLRNAIFTEFTLKTEFETMMAAEEAKLKKEELMLSMLYTAHHTSKEADLERHVLQSRVRSTLWVGQKMSVRRSVCCVCSFADSVICLLRFPPHLTRAHNALHDVMHPTGPRHVARGTGLFPFPITGQAAQAYVCGATWVCLEKEALQQSHAPPHPHGSVRNHTGFARGSTRRDKAAALIQALVRGVAGRARLKAMAAAATLIQRVVRGSRVRAGVYHPKACRPSQLQCAAA